MSPELVSLCYQICMVLVLNRFYTQFLPVKKSLHHPYLLSVSLQLPFAVVCAFLKYSHVHIYSFMIYVYFFLPCFIISQASFLQKLTTEFIAYTVIITGEYTTSLLYSLVNLFYPNSNLMPAELIKNNSLMPQLLCLLLTNLLNIIIFHYLSVLFKMRFTSLGNKTILQLNFPMLISILLMNWLYIIGSLERNQLWYFLLYWLIITLCVPVISAGFKNLTRNEINRLHQEQQISVIQNQITYSQEIQQKYQAIRKTNHDYANHLLILSYLLQKQNKEQIDDYITAITKQLTKEEGKDEI